MHNIFLRTGIFFICALCLLFFIGCGGTSSTTSLTTSGTANGDLDNGRIQGTIIASSTGNILAGAIVETWQAQAITGSDGRYLLGPVPPGDYRVVARASGYSPIVKDGVRVLAGKITENQNFSLSTAAASYDPEFAIVALLPSLGTDGDQISIFCRGCGTQAGKVTFNGKEAQIIDWNSLKDDKITVVVPAEVETGPVKVVIDGQSSKETQSQIFTARPVIISAQPSIARGGQTITLYGRNFNLISQFNKVRLVDALCTTVAVPNEKTMQIQLPQVAKTGTLSIRIESNEYQLDGFSTVVITITPQLIHLSPKRSVPGVPLTVYGYNFGADKNIVKVLFGGHTITPDKFLSFSDNRLSFNVPDNSILPPDKTAEVIVQVNESKSNGLIYTAYNTINNTLTDYGIYDFTTVSTGGTLHLPKLKPTERIVFLSVLSGDGALDLAGDYAYSLSAFMGGNFDQVPDLPAASVKEKPVHEPDLSVRYSNLPVRIRPDVRASLAEPASLTLEVYLRDFTKADPFNSANDILATGTIKATDSVSIVYVDVTAAGIDENRAKEINERFKGIYQTIATACTDGISDPPEGNVDVQKRIALFVSPTLNETSGAEQVASYFDVRDKDPAATNSAGTEILYLNSETYADNKNDFYGGLAQTLSFMIYFNQKGNMGTDWQSMGLSTFARQAAGYGFNQGDTRALNWVSQYLQYSEVVSLNHWPTSPQYYNYGMVFLFTQYLFDRCSGYNAIKILEKKDGSFLGLVDVDNNIIRAGLANPSSLSIREFFHDFCLALFCDDLGLSTGLPGYNADKHQFKNIQLRGKFSGVDGLRGLSYGENPVYSNPLGIKGYGCRMVEYPQGNWGDIEVTINSTPATGDFRTWVIFYSTE
ncbi:MAG: IPT/TIG domain-containing protein [Candidatus Riflebacteria bacterium]